MLAVFAAVTGCSDAASGPATPSAADHRASTSPSVAAVPKPSGASADDGVSAEEAKKHDAFVAAFDAFLALDDLDGSTATLTLENIGKESDQYNVTLEPGAGTVEPNSFALYPGQHRRITVTLDGPADVVVRSRGRGDAVAAVSLAPRS